MGLIGCSLGRRVRPFRAAAFSLHRLSGARELRERVRPSRAGRLSLNLSGECADAARAHKRVDTYGFHPLVNYPFPLEGLAQIADM